MSPGHVDSRWWTQESVCLQRTNVMVIITIYNTECLLCGVCQVLTHVLSCSLHKML